MYKFFVFHPFFSPLKLCFLMDPEKTNEARYDLYFAWVTGFIMNVTNNLYLKLYKTVTLKGNSSSSYSI